MSREINDVIQYLGIDQWFSCRPKWLLKAIYEDETIRFFGNHGLLEFYYPCGYVYYMLPGGYIAKESNGQVKPIYRRQFAQYSKEADK